MMKFAQLDDHRYLRTRPWKLWSRLLSYGLFEGRPLTTKGRWINPLVFVLFSLAIRLPALRKVREPVFILGTGRSGTTVLGIVLSMHREVGFLNEPKALWHAVHPGEDLIGSYTRDVARYRMGAEDATDLRREWIHRIYGAYLAATLSDRVVDKYPELIFRVSFVRALFPDAKFLFLVRNGWDTCHSIEGWSRRLGTKVSGEVHDWWGANNRKWELLVSQVAAEDPAFRNVIDEVKNLSRHTDRAALEWILTMKEGLKLVKELPDCVLMVKYEDMVLHPEGVMKKIIEFCHLSYDRNFFDYACKTLSPAKERQPFEMHPVLFSEFNKTMQDLGYC